MASKSEATQYMEEEAAKEYHADFAWQPELNDPPASVYSRSKRSRRTHRRPRFYYWKRSRFGRRQLATFGQLDALG